MTAKPSPADYLVLSRGKWDPKLPAEQIQQAIDDFYVWHDRLVAEGKMKSGRRLAVEAKRVAKQGIIDGPFSEAKEVIGGYWFIVAESLDEAAAIAAENPCLACGLTYEIRPIDPVRASAFTVTSETPVSPRPPR